MTPDMAVIGLAGISITAFAITPLVLASAPRASSQIEIIRAQTRYKSETGLVVYSPVASASSASLCPDMTLV